MHHRGAPTAELFVGQVKIGDARVRSQQGMHSLTQLANAFAMDNPHLKDLLFPTSFEEFHNDFFNVAWLEQVQIQDPIDGRVHRGKLVR